MTKADRPAIPETTKLAQAIASDPRRSVWVSANAGSGKTYILAQRVIRLMLDGVAPNRILCLTFTRAAAAEMAARIFNRLAEWTRMSDEALSVELRELTGHPPDRAGLERARTLFAVSLDTPGGLKIQTIHAFCEALLHQFPIEADLPSHFEVIESETQEALVDRARREVLSRLGNAPSEGGKRDRLDVAFNQLLDVASDLAISDALGELIARRDIFRQWLDHAGDDPLAGLRSNAGFDGIADEKTLVAGMLSESELDAEPAARIAELARQAGGATNEAFADSVDLFRTSADALDRFRIRRELLLTKAGTPRKSPVTKPVVSAMPGAPEILSREAGRAVRDEERLREFRSLRNSSALFEVAEAILDRYERLKRQAGLSDFNDLITASVNLLNRADIRGWVQYKLDKGIDHVLVDEAQDTSPAQWQIVNALVEEFFAGEGSGPANRTVFAVGDEKQSIYSFQGADPREYLRQAQDLAARAKRGAREFDHVNLHLSFRSTPDILQAVDRVFEDPENRRGLGSADEGPVHEAIRRDPGEVQIWPLFGKQKIEEPTSWLAPVDAVEGNDPAVELAERMARTISGWISEGQILPSENRPVRCGDILILVRRRDRFVNAVMRELKSQGLAIAGADRLILTEHIAIEDLLALGRFVLMPEDDLSLAALLKSPLFEWDDDMLTAVAANRGGARLFDRLHEIASNPEGPQHAAVSFAVGRLGRWLELSRQLRPFEFYARILGGEGGRKALSARLGNEVEDILDAFLESAIRHERTGGLNLEGFISAMTASPPEIKREIDARRDEIRVITVHAAKGLEAPFVFLVDPCTQAFMSSHRPRIVEIEAPGDDTAFLWQPNAASATEHTRQAIARISAAAEEEYRRLLYVGMTRAKDRLVVCGWHGTRQPDHPHWHAMVESALRPEASLVTNAAGEEALVWRRQDEAGKSTEAEAKPEKVEAEQETGLPGWLDRAPPAEPLERIELAPSGAGDEFAAFAPSPALEADTAAERSEPVADARTRGTTIHFLLQHLPPIEPGERFDAANRVLAEKFADWPSEFRDELIREALSVLENPEVNEMLGPQSRAEVPFACDIRIGEKLALIHGRIDRLAVFDGQVMFADFKSDSAPPSGPDAVPQPYILQMVLYRSALREIFGQMTMRGWIVWTRGNIWHEIAEEAMDEALSRYASEELSLEENIEAAL